MRIISVRAVFEDGTEPDEGEPLLISAVNISFPQWTDAQLAIEAVGSDAEPFDITGGAFIFTARTRNEAVPAIISHEGDIVDGEAGTATLDIGSVDTGIATQTLAWNLAFVDADGKIWATTAQGSCAILPSQYIPGQPVTVPESQQPLAEGPQGIQGIQGEQGEQGEPGVGAALADADPLPTGITDPGAAITASRADHVHATKGVFAWNGDTTWAEVEAALEANDNSLTFIMGDSFAPGLPAGAYTVPAGETVNLNGCRFFAPGGYGRIFMEDGASFAEGAFGYLFNLTDVKIMTYGSVIPSGGSVYVYATGWGGFSHDSATEAAFPGCASVYVNVAAQPPGAHVFERNNTQPVCGMASGSSFQADAFGGATISALANVVTGGPYEAYLSFDSDAAACHEVSTSTGVPIFLGGTVTVPAGYPSILGTVFGVGLYAANRHPVGYTKRNANGRLQMQVGGVFQNTGNVAAAAAPVSGTWTRGEQVQNSTPSVLGSAASQYTITGWICAVAGTPGTWVEMRALTGT